MCISLSLLLARFIVLVSSVPFRLMSNSFYLWIKYLFIYPPVSSESFLGHIICNQIGERLIRNLLAPGTETFWNQANTAHARHIDLGKPFIRGELSHFPSRPPLSVSTINGKAIRLPHNCKRRVIVDRGEISTPFTWQAYLVSLRVCLSVDLTL